MRNSTLHTGILAGLGLLGVSGAADAAYSPVVACDFTSSSPTVTSTCAVNSALFQVPDTTVTVGTGNINSFLRVQENGVESGFNTDATKVLNNKDSFTDSLRLSAVPLLDIGGTLYREFLLDINEASNTGGRYLSLDALRFFVAPQDATNPDLYNLYQPAPGEDDSSGGAGGYPGYDPGTGFTTSALLAWSLDLGSNQVVLLDYNVCDDGALVTCPSGSGRDFDLRVLVPNATFRSVFPAGDPWLMLYSSFGWAGTRYAAPTVTGNFTADAGFEEWAVRICGRRGLVCATEPGEPPPPPNPVPEPGSLALLGLGLAGLGMARRRKAA